MLGLLNVETPRPACTFRLMQVKHKGTVVRFVLKPHLIEGNLTTLDVILQQNRTVK